MSAYLRLADWFDALPIPEEPVPNYSSTPHGLGITINRKHRDMIVAALRGADSLQALANLPPQTNGVVGKSHDPA